jgi:hypothetical protein
MTVHTISEVVKENEYNLAKYKAVQAIFPNAKVNYHMQFTDKSVNQLYTNFTFEKHYGLYVIPYYEIPFIWNDVEETIKVHSSPKRNRLAYLSWRTDPFTKKRTMRFSRLSINMKNNKFKDDMLNSCKAEIMNYIKENPTYQLDTKHLEPRLKKLLLFT